MDSRIKEALQQTKSFIDAMSDISYHSQGMGCGIEDLGITDRYDACRFGWEHAIEQVSEQMPETDVIDEALSLLTAEPESCEGASSRDKKGMRVRQIWMAWAQEQPNPKPSWLMPWKDLDEPSREVDRRIGCGLWGDGFAAGLDAFFKADSLVQDARDDERRRCAECCIKILKLAREKIQDHVNEIYSSGGVEYLGLGSTLDGIDKVLKELESNG